MNVIWNGKIHEVDYALPAATVADLIDALTGRWQLPARPTMGIFTEYGIQLAEDAPLPDDDEDYVFRPVVLK